MAVAGFLGLPTAPVAVPLILSWAFLLLVFGLGAAITKLRGI